MSTGWNKVDEYSLKRQSSDRHRLRTAQLSSDSQIDCHHLKRTESGSRLRPSTETVTMCGESAETVTMCSPQARVREIKAAAEAKSDERAVEKAASLRTELEDSQRSRQRAIMFAKSMEQSTGHKAVDDKGAGDKLECLQGQEEVKNRNDQPPHRCIGAFIRCTSPTEA